MTKQYLLVRSAKALLNYDLIGIGWKDVRFTDYGSTDELIKVGFNYPATSLRSDHGVSSAIIDKN